MRLSGAWARRLASSLCWAGDGRETIAGRDRRWPGARRGRGAAGAEELGVVRARGVGVAAANRIGGGAAALVRPTAPLRTAASTATPINPIEQASSQGPRSEGGLGRWADLARESGVCCPWLLIGSLNGIGEDARRSRSIAYRQDSRAGVAPAAPMRHLSG